MKQTIETLKTYFETGDKPTQQQFYDLIDSLYHKDEGKLIISIEPLVNGDIGILFQDQSTFTIPKTLIPDNWDIDQVNGLLDALNNKVTVEPGKQLSTEDFTTVLKDKLENLENSSLSLIPFTVFIDSINGNDITGEIGNIDKPFKTDTAVYNSLPNDDVNVWKIEVIAPSNTTVTFSETIPNRPLKFIVKNRQVNLLFNNSTILHQSDGALGYLDFFMPYSNLHFITSASSVFQTEQLTVKANNLIIDNKGSFKVLHNRTELTNTKIEVNNLEIKNQSQFHSKSNLGKIISKSISINDLTAATYNFALQDFKYIKTESLDINNPSLRIGLIETFEVGNLNATGIVDLDFSYFKLNDTVSNVNILVRADTIITGTLKAGAISGVSNKTFENFTGKIDFSFNAPGTLNIIDSHITLSGRILNITQPDNTVTVNITNSTFIQDTPGDLFTGNQFTLNQVGLIKSNGTSIGTNAILNNLTPNSL
ncbi:hypothetical protein GTQ40_08165 [Flavobacteriaceae bacterium R38]|nr:hypothetical protein [Flavobacteriaceae bacterium R38]